MRRRSFLKALGFGAASAALPASSKSPDIESSLVTPVAKLRANSFMCSGVSSPREASWSSTYAEDAELANWDNESNEEERE